MGHKVKYLSNLGWNLPTNQPWAYLTTLFQWKSFETIIGRETKVFLLCAPLNVVV
jgi:hypothetical protein